MGTVQEAVRRGAAHPATPCPPGFPKPEAMCWEWLHYSYIFALLKPFAGSGEPWLEVKAYEYT